MRVEVTIERTKKLPDGAMSALESELSKRLNNQFSGCRLTVRRATTDSLSIMGGDKDQKKIVETILQETWESADDWFY
ncbi:DNA damage-inducible protein I [Escherichia sp. ESNIH1]|uniref:DinI-like family protein n=1 Tax=Escherichia sp. ESNIH1 TaxID=1985876 RepID=UPI000CDDC10C|nr:DinI-like family protein [Escherichia sp. ESNIH1]POT99525.1 DNA damage-inducible protein I [Escherichia sp. ESNIH1]